jgi:uncharacterized membrane protein
MVAVALVAHIFGAVIWVGGMFAIYVCLRSPLPDPQASKLKVAGSNPAGVANYFKGLRHIPRGELDVELGAG